MPLTLTADNNHLHWALYCVNSSVKKTKKKKNLLKSEDVKSGKYIKCGRNSHPCFIIVCSIINGCCHAAKSLVFIKLWETYFRIAEIFLRFVNDMQQMTECKYNKEWSKPWRFLYLWANVDAGNSCSNQLLQIYTHIYRMDIK